MLGRVAVHGPDHLQQAWRLKAQCRLALALSVGPMKAAVQRHNVAPSVNMQLSLVSRGAQEGRPKLFLLAAAAMELIHSLI